MVNIIYSDGQEHTIHVYVFIYICINTCTICMHEVSWDQRLYIKRFRKCQASELRDEVKDVTSKLNCRPLNLVDSISADLLIQLLTTLSNSLLGVKVESEQVKGRIKVNEWE